MTCAAVQQESEDLEKPLPLAFYTITKDHFEFLCVQTNHHEFAFAGPQASADRQVKDIIPLSTFQYETIPLPDTSLCHANQLLLRPSPTPPRFP
jgi:hypothetical protein